MKFLKLILILQELLQCQGNQNSSSENGKNASHLEHYKNQTIPYITLHFNACSWSPRILKNESWTSVTLTAQSRDKVARQICMGHGCGGVYRVSETIAPPNSTCLNGCIYHDGRLQNCAYATESNCTIVSDVVCGHQIVRLAGGAHHCAGRVELWKEKKWGTVCDDEWDLRDGNIVCAQLGCGYALSVTGQGGAFPKGKGDIYLDELNCTGKEGNLWQCPTAEENLDCGHKEDAGVICSELKEVRLTGGVDRCSGKVEIHRNGSWGTVCDNCWGKEEASMVCSMLGCGKPVNFLAFKPPFTHNNGTLYFYQCFKHHTNLWQCKEMTNKTILCADSKAAGLICSESRGQYLPLTTEGSSTVLNSTSDPMTTTSVVNNDFQWPMSLEVLGCIVLAVLLFIALVTLTWLCCCYRKRYAKQKHANLQMTTECHDNDYKDSVNLVKVTASSPTESEVLSNPRYQWQQSSLESTSVDTDYEQYDLNNELTVPMTTFRNSLRHRQENRNPFLRIAALDSLSEEGMSDQALGKTAGPPSENSFDSSSTSSDECYENTGRDVEILLTSEALDEQRGPTTDEGKQRCFQIQQCGGLQLIQGSRWLNMTTNCGLRSTSTTTPSLDACDSASRLPS
ncbi:T-cell differentiation antigen CD6 isoform X2 [Esox lucius]|uniref:T-cell differentiation antigen CD6 isoform X2 n=1 Tax=Esox lucius TaxID=8010 RepID=UPI00057616AC|nr:T-cell differentiation antigen CD6 isoform X2 [Esox lucius]